MSELERMLTAIRFYEIAREESRRVILCEPEFEHGLRALIDQLGAADVLTVRASPACPQGNLLVIDDGAIDAQWNEWVQGMTKKPIRFHGDPDA